MSSTVGVVAMFASLAAAALPCQANGQESFRTSLTATVSRLPGVDSLETPASTGARDGGMASEAAPDATVDEGRLLRCRSVTLHWASLPDARRYTVLVSVDGNDDWRPLATRNACGRSRVTGTTSMVDVEPTTGGATVVRRLYYEVEAFDRAGAGARLIATTTPVPVRMP